MPSRISRLILYLRSSKFLSYKRVIIVLSFFDLQNFIFLHFKLSRIICMSSVLHNVVSVSAGILLKNDAN